jgi:hypothetical protein
MEPSFRVRRQIQGEARRRAPLGVSLGFFGGRLGPGDDARDVGVFIGAADGPICALAIADVAAFGFLLLAIFAGQLFLTFLEWIRPWSHLGPLLCLSAGKIRSLPRGYYHDPPGSGVTSAPACRIRASGECRRADRSGDLGRVSVWLA